MLWFDCRLLVLLFCCCCSAAGAASGADQVRLQLKWQHQFQFAGYYAALEKGYYREAGLDVEIVPGGPAVDAVRNVLDGKAEFGVGTTDLLLLREKGEPVVVLATIFQHSSLALMTLKTPNPQDLHDLSGKRLMIEPGSAELFAYLRREGITPERYSLLPHGSTVADLLEGKTDGMSVYVTDEPFELHEAKQRFVLYSPRSGGIDFYGDNLFTTENQLRQFPERAKAFRAASLKGWKYAMEHPDEIVTLIHARYSDRHSLAHLRYEAAQMAGLLRADIVEPGHMYAGRWQHIVRVYAELGMLKPNFELGGFLYDTTPRPPDLTRFFAGLAGLAALLLVVVGVALYIVRINRRLESGEKRWRQLFDTLPLALIVSDREEKIIAWNAAATRIFGWRADEALGRDVYELLVPDDQQAHVQRILGQTLDEEATTQSVNRNRTRAGATITCEWHNTIYHNEDGRVSGVILLGADVSERIATQRHLQQAKEMAEQLQANQRQLLSMVSHEFRAPLAVIDSASQLLQLRCASECGSTEVIERVRRGARRLSALIESCLAEDRLNRIETEGWQRQDDVIDLPAFLTSVIDEASLGSPHHALQLDCAAEIESYRGDTQLLRIVLHNLLGNACKYSPPDCEVRLRVAKEASGALVLAVEDVGVGIAPDDLDKVCLRYFRGRNRGQSSGSGLGLFLVERIVKLHCGSLHIDSKVGVGTTVTVRLPPSAANC